MDRPISIAIETSCRRGGVALGAGDRLLEKLDFQADRRHAVQVISGMNELLARRGLRARDLDEVYVSIGPGSFTGLRVGITVARALAQATGNLRCVGVPTVEVVAENASQLDFRHLGVVMAAKEQSVCAAIFTRRAGQIVAAGAPRLVEARQFADKAPKPITLIGEALWFQRFEGQGITAADESLWLPTSEGIWRVGRRMAARQRFQDYHDLRPLYLRPPEAVRLWEKRTPRAEE